MSAIRLPPWAFLVIGVVPITVLALLGGGLPRTGVLIAAMIAMVWAAVMVGIHWKRLDEAARAAHRWAWYWGGSIGLAAAMVIGALALTSADAGSAIVDVAKPFVNAKLPPEQSYLFLGVMLTGVAQGAGFLGAWLFWWAAKR